MHRRRTTRLTALLLALGITGAACQADATSTGTAPAGDGGGTASAPDAGSTTPSDDGEVDDEGRAVELAPLQAFLSEMFDVGTQEAADVDEHMNLLRRQEELVAACMSEQGFDYVPIQPRDWRTAAADGPWTLEQEEFVAQYGYGITTIDHDQLPGGRSEDPNVAIVAGMPEAERQAYREALYGVGVEVIAGDRVVAPAPEFGDDVGPSGCLHQASVEVWGDGSQEQPDYSAFEGLIEDMQALWERIEADPRVAEATDGYAACMADAGYPGIATPEDAYTTVREHIEAHVSSDDADDPDHPSDDADDDAAMLAADRSGAFAGGQPDLTGLDPAVVQELRDHEIAVAVADERCGRPIHDARLEVQIELEQRFLDDNRAELERYRDALGTTGGVG